MTLVSVIIPTHNRQEWLGEAIQSVVQQTHSDWEIIVVDDGSTQDIAGFVEQHFSDLRIRVIRSETATSPGAARNRGVAVAVGEFISFLDSDDLWYPSKLERQLAVLAADREAEIGFVGSGCDYIDQYGQPTLKPTLPPQSATYEDFIFKIKMPGSGSNNLIRKAAFDYVGGFREDLQRAEDKQLWLKLLQHYQVGYVADVLVTVRIHSTTRIHVNDDILLRNRLSVDNEICDRKQRNKAIAFTYFVLFQRNWPARRSYALKALCQSFWHSPSSISDDIHRLKGVYYALRG